MVSMSSLDAINIDDDSSAFKDVFVDISYIKNCIDTLTNEELEKVIEHCNMLIERNNIEMGGV
jgi:hypothetical protein